MLGTRQASPLLHYTILSFSHSIAFSEIPFFFLLCLFSLLFLSVSLSLTHTCTHTYTHTHTRTHNPFLSFSFILSLLYLAKPLEMPGGDIMWRHPGTALLSSGMLAAGQSKVRSFCTQCEGCPMNRNRNHKRIFTYISCFICAGHTSTFEYNGILTDT